VNPVLPVRDFLYRMNSEKFKKLAQNILAPYLYKSAYSRAFFTVWGLAIRECQSCFYQFFTIRSPFFSLFRAFKYFFHGLIRLFLGRSIRISYGYKAEDRLIESLLKPIITQNGFYVDIGCNDPRFLSNTFLLYRRGWKGICVDPNEKLIRKHTMIRPRDQAICAFISDVESELEYVELDNDTLSTADPAHLKHAQESGHKIVSKKKMNSSRLTTILDQFNAPPSFDLLSVDAEGNDLKVLRSLDFGKYCPRLVVVEADDFDPSNPTAHEIYQFMISQHYYFHGSILTNLYFLKDKKEIFS
jgi:FkbM family methyltransferase